MKAGVQIKIRLLENRLTQAWLIFQLEQLDLSLDKSTLCDILSGRRKGQKANEVIEKAEFVLKKYEETYARALTA